MAYKLVNTPKIGSEILVDTRHSTVKSSKYNVIRISLIKDNQKNNKKNTHHFNSFIPPPPIATVCECINKILMMPP